MKFSLIIRPEAEADLAEAKDWYERQRPGLGLEFTLSVEETLDRIRRMPHIHAEIYKEVRRTSTRRFPYGVYYRLVGDSVVVIAVMHGRRDQRGTPQTRLSGVPYSDSLKRNRRPGGPVVALRTGLAAGRRALYTNGGYSS